MNASLYEALGISPNASDEEVRASLRRLIRKYYAKTRDGQGNVEEALRFINHASRILSEPDRRARYDAELAQSTGAAAKAVAHVATNTMAPAGEQTDVAPGGDSVAERIALAADPEDSRTARSVHHPGLTEPVASFGRPTVVTFALCALFGGFIAAAIVLVMPTDTVQVAKQVLVWLTVTLLSLTAVYGVVHGVAWARHRNAAPVQVMMPQTDLAILNWRREKSVFLGTSQPQEDASWIFQLRMAELERAKTGRTSEPRPWNRLAARLFDYAIWGIVLALLLSELRGADLVPDDLGFWLGHPLVAPVLITGSWIAVETLLMASLGTTPGKWLFGCYLQFSISDAYARREMRSQLLRSFRRAFRVWWEGVGCGIPLLAPILIAIAYERVVQKEETAVGLRAGLPCHPCAAGHAQYGDRHLRAGGDALAVRCRVAPSARRHDRVGRHVDHGIPAVRAIAAPFGTQRRHDHGRHQRLDAVGAAGAAPAPSGAGSPASRSAPIDAEVARLFAERSARIATLKVEGPRMLRSGNFRRAAELCSAWADLELANADAWRCLGEAQQALGNHQEAIECVPQGEAVRPRRPDDRRRDRAQPEGHRRRLPGALPQVRRERGRAACRSLGLRAALDRRARSRAAA